MQKSNTREFELVVGIDLGDKYSTLCVLNAEDGCIEEESRITTSEKALTRRFSNCEPMHIAIEIGTHSPWVSRLLESLGHKVTIANPRKVALISKNKKKTDKIDAMLLARLARADVELLSPIKHRGEKAQQALAVVRARDASVSSRTDLINHVRGACKSAGYRLESCSPGSFAKRASRTIPAKLKPALQPILDAINLLNEKIKEFDKRIARMCEEEFPTAMRLQQVGGVGPLTALGFILVLEDPARFKKSRSVGAYLGLTPAKDESSESNPQLRITKEGDALLRKLLVNSGQYILGHFGKDCDLRRHGEKIAARGGKNAKKRAVVAVARKLSVMLHAMWRNGTDYEPFRAQNCAPENKPAPFAG